MRLLFVGDVVGRAGRMVVQETLPGLIADYALDFVVVNGENAAGGFGITEEIFMDLLDAGADAVTTGNHVWDQREALVFCARHDNFLRPLNYPAGTPGKGAGLFTARNGGRVLVMNAMGRVFMNPMDDPFQAVQRELDAAPLGSVSDAVMIDFHAEATSEKQIMGHFADGQASLVVGTHTHAPTADHQILDGGTAFMTDAGMTGDYNSIIGMEASEPLQRMTSAISAGRFQPALGAATLSGVAVLTDDSTGLALRVEPVRLGGRLQEHIPAFWIEQD
uniref:TIGR00282 family metallophosphoesterase n=1 Tax=Pararhizobium sp. IMCC3301 TaxID=3067904 RepID=UPI0027411266|nr:TIGR00282 family metallophosphoesterase [Pararhizobium sp. IMCC3301]